MVKNHLIGRASQVKEDYGKIRNVTRSSSNKLFHEGDTMNKIVSAALLSLVTGATSLGYIQPAKAERVVYCTPVTRTSVSKDAADHPHAYADGYREGQQSARRGEDYKPRSTGGEFARGFDDGYYNRRYTGQEYVVPNAVVQSTTQYCDPGYEVVAPPPTVGIYVPVGPRVFIGGGWRHRW
jgi:hypothetical protein